MLLKKILGDRFIKLPVREVENLLAPSVLVKVVQSYEGAEVEPTIPVASDYASEPLGSYIEKTLLQDKSKRTSKSGHPYEADSGTLKGKVAFAKKAIGLIAGPDQMTVAAKEVTERLLTFIAEQNPGPWGGQSST